MTAAINFGTGLAATAATLGLSYWAGTYVVGSGFSAVWFGVLSIALLVLAGVTAIATITTTVEQLSD